MYQVTTALHDTLRDCRSLLEMASRDLSYYSICYIGLLGYLMAPVRFYLGFYKLIKWGTIIQQLFPMVTWIKVKHA